MPNKTSCFSARKRLIVVAISACFASAPAWGNPTLPQVVNGSASFNQAGNLLTVSNSNGAIINWNTFSIGANETTRFNQSSAASSVLNRVITNDPSVLLGALSSNGKVWLVNPAGIMVGQGARIDVAGFVASTLNIRNEDFLAGRLNFEATPNAGSIQNYGKITTPAGGSVYLISPNVENHGIVHAPNGEVILAAGQTAQLIDTGTPGVKVEITGEQGNATNLGEIVAEAGRIGMAGVLVRNSGTLNASSIVREGGRIFLKASQDAYVDGAGRIVTTGAKGGGIEVLGNRVAVMDQAQLDASGNGGGGTVLVGGDYQGRNPDVQNASITYVGPQTSIKADATTNGDGGKVVVWADDTTRAYGSISARGGANGGDGGLVETSGSYLEATGKVDTLAPRGKAGNWLLDPLVLEVASSGGSAYNVGVNNIFADNPTGTTILTPASINAASSNVTLQAVDDVKFTDAVNISTATMSLTATAGRSILVNNDITTNNGNVSLFANDESATIGTRSAGPGGITMADGKTINAGTGMVLLRVGLGAGGGKESGNLTVANITAHDVNLQQNGATNGASNILRASSSSLITARNVLLEIEHFPGPAANGSVGTAAAPMRVAPFGGSDINLESHTHEASPGIFIEAPNAGTNLYIGDVPFFGGGVNGVQTVTSGAIEIKATVAGSSIITNAGTATCAFGAGTGGPICAGGLGDSIKLIADGSITGNGLIAAASGTLHAKAGTGIKLENVSAGQLSAINTTSGDIEIRTSSLTTVTSPYASGYAIYNQAADGKVVLAANSMNFSDPGLVSAFGTVALKPLDVDNPIDLRAAPPCGSPPCASSALLLTSSQLARVVAPTLEIGDSGTSGSIAINGAINLNSSADSLVLKSNSDIWQALDSPVTVNNLALVAGRHVDMQAANMVNTLAGAASGDFLFRNGKPLAIGSVAGYGGVSIGRGYPIDGGEGANIKIEVNGGSLTVDQPIVADARGGCCESGAATVSLKATGIMVNGDGGDGGKVLAYGGDASYGGGSAWISLDSNGGPLVLDNGASLEAYGGRGSAGSGSVTWDADCACNVYAEGAGGNATITLDGGSGQILLKAGSSVYAGGGDSDYNKGGDAAINFTASGGIGILGGSSIEAAGGYGLGHGAYYDAGSEQYVYIGNGGKATVKLDGASGPIVLNNASIVATGGNGEDSCDYYEPCGAGSGGAAEVALMTTGSGSASINGHLEQGIALRTGSYIEAYGGYGAGKSSFYDANDDLIYPGAGGKATIALDAGDGPIVLDGASIYARGGDSDAFDGGRAKISLTTTSGSITVQNGSSIEADGGEGGGLSSYYDLLRDDSFYFGSGGDAKIKLTTQTGGIAVTSASVLKAYGGRGEGEANYYDEANGDYVYSGKGGAAKIRLDGGSGPVVLDSAYVYAGGGDSDAYNGGDARIKMVTSGSISLTNSSVSAEGGSGNSSYTYYVDNDFGSGDYYLGDGGKAKVKISAGNGITMQVGSTVSAQGGSGAGSDSYTGDSEDTVYPGNGGYAKVKLDGGSGSIALDASSSISVNGGSGSWSGGDAEAVLTAIGNIAMQSGTHILASGGDCSECEAVATIDIASANGKITGGLLDTSGGTRTIYLNALTGIGQVGNPVRIADPYASVYACNGSDISCAGPLTGAAGDIFLSWNAGNVWVDDHIGNVTNRAPNGGYDFTAENGNVVLSSGSLAANGSGNIGLHALDSVIVSGSITTNGGSIVLHSNTGNDDTCNIQLLTDGSLSSNGGNIVLGGGADPLTGYAHGSGGTQQTASGIYIAGDINAGSGNVTMHGHGASGFLPADGIAFVGGTLTSNGTVTIDGMAQASNFPDFVAGVHFANSGTRLTTATGTVNVTGTNTSSGVRAQGVIVDGATIETTGAGTLTLIGTADTSNLYPNTNWGVGVWTGGTVRTTGGGAVTLIGAAPFGDGGIVAWNGNVTSSNSGEIRMLSQSGGIGVQSGAIIGGAGSGNILLKVNDSSLIDVVSGSIDSGANTLTLSLGGGTASDNNNAITAGALRLLGSGTFSLGGSNNTVGTLAGNVTGSITYRNTANLAIGGVTSFDGSGNTTTTGLAAYGGSGSTMVQSNGDITLNSGASVSSNASGNAIVLASAGAFTNNSSATALAAPSGRWLVYAPDPGNVTKSGMTSAFRHYNATLADYASPGESGNGFIYAPVPGTITVDTTLASGSASNTFGQIPTAVFGYSLVGAVDKEDITGTATFSPAISSTTNVGSYNILYTGGLTSASSYSGTGLGSPVSYAIDPGTGLAYTVDPAIVAVAVNASLTGTANKTYDGTTTATLTPANFLLSGFVNSDSASVTQTTGAYASKNVGSGILVSTSLSAGDFSPAGSTNFANYILPTSASGNIGVITPASVTVSGVTAQNKVYDATTVATIAGTAALTGVIGSDAVTLGGSAVGSFADKNVGVAKPVTVTGFTLSGADAGNYTLSSASAGTTASITPASLSVSGLTAQNKVYDATTKATVSGTAVFSGLLGSDVVTLGGSAVGSFADKNVGVAKPVTVTGLTLSGADAGNYTLSSTGASSIADITSASLTLSGLTAQNKVYDATTVATLSGTGALSGILGSDVVTLGGSPSGSFADKNVGVAKSVTVTGLALSGADAGNYTLATAGATTKADITPASLTLSGLAAQNKVYDATTVATLSGTPAFSGVLGSDVVTLGGSPSGSFADKNVGLAKPVSVAGFALAGADAGNYTLAPPEGFSADITPATLALSGVTAANKAYDGKTTAIVSSGLAGVLGGDAVAVEGTGAFADKNVGAAKPVLASFSLSGTDAGNYILSGTTATSAADITVRPVSTWIGGPSGNWSLAANWDALPDLSNVQAVSIPAGVSVTYDAGAGSTNLASLTAGGINLAGGSLNIANSLSVSSSFSLSGGALALGGGATANITQASGNLSMPAMSVASLTLNAPAGSISQSGAIAAATLNTQSQSGTTLNNAGNRIASFGAANSGSGNISLINASPLTITGISNSGGNISVDNTGAVITTGVVSAPAGVVSILAHSPLTIGSGGVVADGNITLSAGNTSGSGDNLTLSGPVGSTGSSGSVSLTAGDDLMQGASVSTNGGAVSATAETGNISMALGATTSSGGGSIGYAASAGNVVLTSLNAGSGAVALNAGKSIQSAAGYTGANLVGGKAVIVAGANANLSTQVKQLNVTAAGTYAVTDATTGTVLTPASSSSTSTAAPVVSQVLSSVTSATQQQAAPTTSQTTTQAPPPQPAPAATGGAGPLLLSNTTQTIGGTEGTFGGTSSNSSASGAGDKSATAKPADDKVASTKKDETKADEKQDDKKDEKKKDEETTAKKDEAKPAAKKLATCS